jgi:hypothetical protein
MPAGSNAPSHEIKPKHNHETASAATLEKD